MLSTLILESTIAEKFDAILQRFELTGRMKDFYDIYYLARTFDFEGAKLRAAIFETLKRRKTPYDRDSFKRILALSEDEDMQKRWRYFLKNIKDGTLEFAVVIKEMQRTPPYLSLQPHSNQILYTLLHPQSLCVLHKVRNIFFWSFT